MSRATDTTKAEPTKRFAYRVVPMGDVWEVMLPGDSVPVGLHLRKEEAIRHARELARKEHSAGVIVYDADGRIESESYAD